MGDLNNYLNKDLRLTLGINAYNAFQAGLAQTTWIAGNNALNRIKNRGSEANPP